MKISSVIKEPVAEDKASFSRALPLFIFGMVFAFWCVCMVGFLIPFMPEVSWDKVSGYFTFAIASFVPAIIPYLMNQYYNRKEREQPPQDIYVAGP